MPYAYLLCYPHQKVLPNIHRILSSAHGCYRIGYLCVVHASVIDPVFSLFRPSPSPYSPTNTTWTGIKTRSTYLGIGLAKFVIGDVGIRAVYACAGCDCYFSDGRSGLDERDVGSDVSRTILLDGGLTVAQDWRYRIWLQMSGCGGTSSPRCLTISEISFWWCLRYVSTRIRAFGSSWNYSIRHL
jgi:hypothetical protein